MLRSLALLLVGISLLACAPPSASTPPAPPHATPTPISTSQSPTARLDVGWAYEAYPETSSAQMLAEMTRMRQGGANSIWIGHNNPGDVDAGKIEPGLSFAVWYALEHEAGIRRAQADLMAQSVRRALDAARAAGLRAVLPIGYQIMMGATWNRLHPEALRQTYDGKLLQIYDSPATASPYSPAYRQDMNAYYNWIEREWVEPYRDTIILLSLSDEPQGGDYSAFARSEFEQRYGKPMQALAADEQWKVGEFEAGVVVDFAAWSANIWKSIDPRIQTTISFHSGDARSRPGLPDVERLFAETPDNFIITFDTYLHDDLPAKSPTDVEVAQLELFLTTLGHYSRVYQKPLILWAGANTWGLAQESSKPLGVSDATTNLALLYDLPVRVGGDVRGIFAWNYNVKGQGLYNFNGKTIYPPQALEAAMEIGFRLLQSRSVPIPAEPEVAIIVSPRELDTAIALAHSADLPPAWFDSARLAQTVRYRSAAVVTAGPSLAAIHNPNILLFLARSPYVDEATLALLKTSVQEGKVVLAWEDVAGVVDTPRQIWPAGWSSLPDSGGVLYLVQSTSPAK